MTQSPARIRKMRQLYEQRTSDRIYALVVAQAVIVNQL